MSKYAVMLFETEFRLGISSHPGKWVNTNNYFFDNGAEALNTYSNIPNPASQLIKGDSDDDLYQQMEEMKANYRNEDWLNENLYPYM